MWARILNDGYLSAKRIEFPTPRATYLKDTDGPFLTDFDWSGVRRPRQTTLRTGCVCPRRHATRARKHRSDKCHSNVLARRIAVP
jgi:hypothetical protein